jgi:hypothetical protein
MQNEPNPDVNTPNMDIGGGQNESDVEPTRSDKQRMPLPADEPQPAPVEEPPEVRDKPSIDEGGGEATRIV